MNSNRQLLEGIRSASEIIRETAVAVLRGQNVDIFAKLEFLNGIGSVKDRPAFWILKHAIERGEVEPGTTIIESSSGNFACALATLSKILQLKFIPVIDRNVSPLHEGVLRSQCARVVKVEERDETGGYLKTRLSKVKELLSEIQYSYWPNQYENVDGMDAHFRMTGEEIATAVPALDYVFLPVSSAATVAGVSRCLKEKNSSIQIIAVDVEGSMIFQQTPKERSISGIGSSISPPLLQYAIIDQVMVVPEAHAIRGCHELLERHALFVGGSTGAVYSAIGTYFGKQRSPRRPKVLFLCCDRGNAYLHNIFNGTIARRS